MIILQKDFTYKLYIIIPCKTPANNWKYQYIIIIENCDVLLCMRLFVNKVVNEMVLFSAVTTNTFCSPLQLDELVHCVVSTWLLSSTSYHMFHNGDIGSKEGERLSNDYVVEYLTYKPKMVIKYTYY